MKIDRNLLDSNLIWYSGTLDDVQVHTRKEIDHRIDQWKVALKQQASHGPGCRAVLNFQTRNLDWLAVMLANWELGGQQVLVNPTFPELWSPWNVMVSDNSSLDHLKSHVKHCLFSNVDQYVSSQFDTQPSLCQPSNLALATNTSGSTGTPDRIENTHEFLHALIQRNIKISNFDQFKHGSALLVHGGTHNSPLSHVLAILGGFEQVHSLPFVSDRMQDLGQYVKDHKINVVLLPHVLAVDLFLKQAPRFDHAVVLMHFQANQTGWIDIIKEKNIQCISSSYGAVEVPGPILINEITQQSDSLYLPFNFGKLLDNFYQVQLTDDGELEVNNQYLGVRVLSDYFTHDDQDNLIYHNRNKHICLHGHDVHWDALEKCVRTHGSASYMCIVGDEKTGCVYMLFDQSYSRDQLDVAVKNINTDLAKVNSALFVDYVDHVNIIEFINSHKVNLFQVKEHFRNKFNLLEDNTHEKNN
jgi:hypothetical protein